MKILLSLERGLRKFFERAGVSIDRWLYKGTPAQPSARDLSNRLAPIVYKSIDNALREDDRGVTRLAPHRVVVALDYNTFAQLEQPEIRALKTELEQVALEYILNRRYTTQGKVSLSVTYDPLVAAPVVRADFGRPAAAAAGSETSTGPVHREMTPSGRLALRLRSIGSRVVLDASITKLRPGGTPVTIGRGRDNDVVIDDRSVSKFHATIGLTQDGKLIVADVGSTNGTFVNNKPVQGRAVIDIGDVLTFGEVDVKIEV